MDFQKRLSSLQEAIDLSDVKKIHELILENPEVLYHPDSINLNHTLLYCGNGSDYQEILELLNLPRFFSNTAVCGGSLYKNFISEIASGDLQKVEFLILKGIKAVHPTLPYTTVFKIRKNGIRAKMLLVLLKYELSGPINDFPWVDDDDVDDNNCGGKNIIHYFIHGFVNKTDNDAVEVVKILLNSGIPIDDVDFENYSALHYCIVSEHFELQKFLIKQGADVNNKRSERLFPLCLAVIYENEDMVKLLLSHDAEINAKNGCQSWTALHAACFQHCDRIISLLINKGADITVQDENGETPFALLKPNKNDHYNQSIINMIKRIAKVVFQNLPLLESDMKLLKENIKALELYNQCTAELEQMVNTEFFAPNSIYSMINGTISMKKLAYLTKNEELVSKFEDYLPRFSNYSEDLQRILKEAIILKDKLDAIENKLDSVFAEIFPSVIVRNFIDYLTVDKLILD